MDQLPSSYPLPKIHGDRVFFLDLNTFKDIKIAAKEKEIRQVRFKAINARISAPIGSIRSAFDRVPFFQQDVFCRDLSFEEKARFVYLASCFEGDDKQDLYNKFKAHWMQQKEICPLGIQVLFLKNNVEDMRMSV